MNTVKNQTENNGAQAGTDYCQTTYNMSGREVVNSYKCNQQPFATSDLWRIRRKSKGASIRKIIL